LNYRTMGLRASEYSPGFSERKKLISIHSILLPLIQNPENETTIPDHILVSGLAVLPAARQRAAGCNR
jgi:hypothetical protein